MTKERWTNVDEDDDEYGPASHEIITYFCVLLFFAYFNFFWIAVSYFVIGYCIIFDDEDDQFRDDDENPAAIMDTDLYALGQRSLLDISSPFALMVGVDVADYEDPILPGSYKILDAYYRLFLARLRVTEGGWPGAVSKRRSKGATPLIQQKRHINYLKYRTQFSAKFYALQGLASGLERGKFLRYKTTAVARNEYYEIAFLRQGLYSTGEFPITFCAVGQAPWALEHTDYKYLSQDDDAL